MAPKSRKHSRAVWLCLAMIAQPGWAADKAPSPDEALAQIVTYKFGQSRQALSVVEGMVLRAANAPGEDRRVAAKLTPLLATGATLECKRFVCRQLATLGSKESVPALAALLPDEQLSDMARYALEAIAAPAAGQALLDALGKSNGNIRIGIINSLGNRHDSAAVPALARLIKNADLAVAEAAIAALGKIGGEQVVAALAQSKDGLPAQLHAPLINASLLCADRFSKTGAPSKAVALYEAASAPGEPDLIRIAALKGLVAVNREKALPLVLRQLVAPQRPLQAAAMGLVRDLPPGEAVTKALVDHLPKLPEDRQSLLLTALADRGDGAALPAVVASLESKDRSVRIAALRALGRLGGKEVVTPLARAAATTTDAEQEAARASLAVLRGNAVDEFILSSLNNSDANARAELARCLGPRGGAEAVKTLLRTAKDPDTAVRLASLQSLGDLAAESDVPALVALLLQSKSEEEREQAGRALVAISRRGSSPDRGIEAPLAALREARDAATKVNLLGVISKIGGVRAVRAVEAALRDGNAEVRDAAVRALAASSDPEALPTLMQIARKDDAAQRLLALQGSIRLLDLPSSRSPAETVAAYKEAFALATRMDEKKQVLAGLQRVRAAESLKFVMTLLSDKELGSDAARAVLRLVTPGRRSSISHEEAHSALKQLLAVSQDEAVRQRATMILESTGNR